MLAFAPVYGEWNDYFGDYKWQKLTTAAAFYGYDWQEHTAHDSMGDVQATLFVFNKLSEKKIQNHFVIGEKFFDRMEWLYILCEDPSASLPDDLTLSLDDNLQPPCISLSKSTCYILDGFYYLYGRRIDNDAILRTLLQSVDFTKWSESKVHSELSSMKLRDLNNPDNDMRSLLPEYRTTEDMEWFEDLDRLPPLSSGNSIFISWELKEILDDLEGRYDFGCIEGDIRHTHVPQSVIVGKIIRDIDLERLGKVMDDQMGHEDPYRIKVACEYFRMGGLDISERS